MATSLGALRAGPGDGKNASPLAVLNNFFAKNKSQLEVALPKHLNADRMVRLALTAFSQNKQLGECDPRTIFASVVVASQLGLEIGVTGQAYLVPYKGKCTFVPGWQGMVDLVSRSGRASCWTGAVFEGDDFDYALGDTPFIRHRPGGEDEPAKLRYVYAVGRVKGADWPIIEVWPIERVRRHRDKFNKVGTRHYSFENWEMYARKVPLLQVIKYLPKSIELSQAIAADAAAEAGQGITIDGDGLVNIMDDDAQDTPMKEETPSRASSAPVDNVANDVAAQLRAAKTIDALEVAADLIRTAPADKQEQLTSIFRECKAALSGSPRPAGAQRQGMHVE